MTSPLATTEIEAIWCETAAALGWRVCRTEQAYATSDGQGTLLIGVDAILDAGDAVAQLVFHELCHALVEGPTGWPEPDWGLSNTNDRHVVREHACLRVQVHLAEPFGLRELMAPTTEYRTYHDAIAGDPLTSDGDPAAAVARDAILRPETAPWVAQLRSALDRTRALLGETLLGTAGTVTIHPVGFPMAPSDLQETCGTCAWRYLGGRGRAVERCRQAADATGQGRRTRAQYRACSRWEAPVDCQSCGACCREAYHSVTVAVRDPVVWKHPHLVERHGHRFEIQRSGSRCAALAGNGQSDDRYRCDIYDDRPRPCREFEANGPHCLVARRRVGLSA